MGKYAVINPANGETVKDYPDLSDGDLEAAIGAAAAGNSHSIVSRSFVRGAVWKVTPVACQFCRESPDSTVQVVFASPARRWALSRRGLVETMPSGAASRAPDRWGSVPMAYSAKLFSPSPSGSATAAALVPPAGK